MKYIIYVLGLLIIIICFNQCECTPEERPPKAKPIKHNFVVLLDLSDRILKEDQILRDKTLILHIYDTFLKKLQNELYYAARDEFKIAIAHQENGLKNTSVFKMLDRFYINAETVPISKKVKIRDGRDKFKSDLIKLYKSARISDNPNDYYGANIQSYLQNELDDHVYRDSLTKNYLIILTDGYQYVKGLSGGLNDWHSIGDLSDIEVVVLEMDPNRNRPDETQIMNDKWKDWLTRMNAEAIHLHRKGSIQMIKERVDKIFNGQYTKVNNTPPPSEVIPEDSEASTLPEIEIDVKEKTEPEIEEIKPKPPRKTKKLKSKETGSTGATNHSPGSNNSSKSRTVSPPLPPKPNKAEPELNLSIDSPDLIYRNSRTTFSLNYNAQNDDRIVWESDPEVRITGGETKQPNLRFPKVGIIPLYVKVQRGEGEFLKYVEAKVRIKSIELEDLFGTIIEYGNDGNMAEIDKTYFNELERKMDSSVEELKSLINHDRFILSRGVTNTEFEQVISQFTANKSASSQILNFRISDVVYDKENGLINEIVASWD